MDGITLFTLVARRYRGLWGLPEAVVEAVTFHHHPADCLRAGLGLPDIVHVANALEREKTGKCRTLTLSACVSWGLSTGWRRGGGSRGLERAGARRMKLRLASGFLFA